MGSRVTTSGSIAIRSQVFLRATGKGGVQCRLLPGSQCEYFLSPRVTRSTCLVLFLRSFALTRFVLFLVFPDGFLLGVAMKSLPFRF